MDGLRILQQNPCLLLPTDGVRTSGKFVLRPHPASLVDSAVIIVSPSSEKTAPLQRQVCKHKPPESRSESNSVSLNIRVEANFTNCLGMTIFSIGVQPELSETS
eukprot:765648-Hanusia_phi.AAC.3